MIIRVEAKILQVLPRLLEDPSLFLAKLDARNQGDHHAFVVSHESSVEVCRPPPLDSYPILWGCFAGDFEEKDDGIAVASLLILMFPVRCVVLVNVELHRFSYNHDVAVKYLLDHFLRNREVVASAQ